MRAAARHLVDQLDLPRRRRPAVLHPEPVPQLLEQATLALLTYVEDESDGFRILVRESPVPLADSGGFATIISDIASQVEHILAAEFAARGFQTTLAALHSQALVGQVALVGQWCLDHRESGRTEVAAHLVDLALACLAALEAAPAHGAASSPAG